MEEPHFIKCESDWLSVTEPPPNLNTHETLPIDVEKIKIEPDLAFTDLFAEEHTLGIVKEELDVQDVKEELDDTGGPCIKDLRPICSPLTMPMISETSPCFEMNPVLLSPVAEGAVINSVKLTERMRPNEKHLEATPQIQDTTNLCHVPFNSLLPSHKGTITGKNAKKSPSCYGCGKTLIGPGYGGPSRRKLFCMSCIDEYSQSSDDTEQPYVQSNPFVCSTCGKIFNAQRPLAKHVRSHGSRKKYGCKTCGKRFTRNFTLKIHNQIHTGERRHKCTECIATFSQLVQLRTHMLIHERSLPYKCSICGRAYGLRAQLYKHILVHTETDGLTLKRTE